MTNEIYKKAMAKENRKIRIREKHSECLTYSVQEAADLYGCSAEYIRKEIRNGNLKAATNCKNWRIDKNDFTRWYDLQMS